MRTDYLKWIPALLALTMTATADSGVDMSDCEVEPQPCYYEYHNRISVFLPWHQAYERIEVDAFYAGVETWALATFSTDHRDKIAALGEIEVRFGYNYFYNGKDHVTPFVGVGVIKDFTREHWFGKRREKSAVVYGVFGILYDHEFNSVFNLGFHFKGLIGGPVDTDSPNWGSPVGGIDVSLPITFRFGNKRHWDIRIEPFDIYLRGRWISRNYFGGRSTIGYRF